MKRWAAALALVTALSMGCVSSGMLMPDGTRIETRARGDGQSTFVACETGLRSKITYAGTITSSCESGGSISSAQGGVLSENAAGLIGGLLSMLGLAL